jgi:hypothetical protein
MSYKTRSHNKKSKKRQTKKKGGGELLSKNLSNNAYSDAYIEKLLDVIKNIPAENINKLLVKHQLDFTFHGTKFKDSVDKDANTEFVKAFAAKWDAKNGIKKSISNDLSKYKNIEYYRNGLFFKQSKSFDFFILNANEGERLTRMYDLKRLKRLISMRYCRSCWCDKYCIQYRQADESEKKDEKYEKMELFKKGLNEAAHPYKVAAHSKIWESWNAKNNTPKLPIVRDSFNVHEQEDLAKYIYFVDQTEDCPKNSSDLAMKEIIQKWERTDHYKRYINSSYFIKLNGICDWIANGALGAKKSEHHVVSKHSSMESPSVKSSEIVSETHSLDKPLRKDSLNIDSNNP